MRSMLGVYDTYMDRWGMGIGVFFVYPSEKYKNANFLVRDQITPEKFL